MFAVHPHRYAREFCRHSALNECTPTVCVQHIRLGLTQAARQFPHHPRIIALTPIEYHHPVGIAYALHKCIGIGQHVNGPLDPVRIVVIDQVGHAILHAAMVKIAYGMDESDRARPRLSDSS